MDCINKSLISGYLYVDLNGDGLKEAREKGIKQTQVQIFDTNEKIVKTTYTDVAGLWKTDLCEGKYILKVDFQNTSRYFLNKESLEVSVEDGKEYPNTNFVITQSNSIDASFFVWIFVSLIGAGIIGLAYKKIQKLKA